MLEEAVESSGGTGHVAEQFAPLFQRPAARHHRRTHLVSPQDDLEEILTRALGQLLYAHVIHNEQVGFQVTVVLRQAENGVVIREPCKSVPDRRARIKPRN